MDVEVRMTANGWIVRLHGDSPQEYVFKSTEAIPMLEFIGKAVNGRKVKVVES